MEKFPLVVLSAGIGQRFGGLKQLQGVGPNGEVILDYSIYDAIRAGFKRLIFVIRREIEEDFRKIIGDYWEKKVDVEYAYQELNSFFPLERDRIPVRNKPWGTAHAILVCKSLVDSPFAVINADDFYGFESLKIVFSTLSELTNSNEYIIVGFKLKDTLSAFGHVSRAILKVDQDFNLIDISEIPKIKVINGEIIGFNKENKTVEFSGEELVSMNLFAFNKSIFNFLEAGFFEFLKENLKNKDAEFGIYDFLMNFLKKDAFKIKVIKTFSLWFGITHPEDLKIVQNKVQEIINSGEYPRKMRE
ncbi:MAG: sugar phosphate nucleotidyltransferase [Candidatus Aminicenantia bacterium]